MAYCLICKLKPHQTSHFQNLEQVQRRAARFIHQNYAKQTPGCVTNMVQSLGWESLQHRWFTDRLCCPIFRMVWLMSLLTTSNQTTPIREAPNICINYRQPKTYTSTPFTLVLSVIGIGYLPLLPTSIPCRNSGRPLKQVFPTYATLLEQHQHVHGFNWRYGAFYWASRFMQGN